MRDALKNVTVKEHIHTVENGKCACGYVCTHTKADGTSAIENGECTVCNTAFVAMVKVNNTTAYHADIAAALEAAEDNGTVKIIAAENTLTLPDQSGYPVLYADGTITLDLNGHTLSGGGLIVGGGYNNSNSGNLTVTDSAGGGSISLIRAQPKGTVHFKGKDTTTCRELFAGGDNNDPYVQLYSGVISKITLSGNTRTLAQLLAVGYCFYSYDETTAKVGDAVKLSELADKEKVTFPLAVGECSHPEAGADGKCLYCGLKLGVRDSKGNIYNTLQEAIDAALSDNSIM